MGAVCAPQSSSSQGASVHANTTVIVSDTNAGGGDEDIQDTNDRPTSADHPITTSTVKEDIHDNPTSAEYAPVIPTVKRKDETEEQQSAMYRRFSNEKGLGNRGSNSAKSDRSTKDVDTTNYSTTKPTTKDSVPPSTLPWLGRLRAVSDGVNGMWSDAREQRAPWDEYLRKASELLEKPRKPLPQDVVKEVICGDLTNLHRVPSMKKKVLVFVSSTFTDTTAERNALMKDVYPYVRGLCRRLGLEFGTVDMRWGVREETTMEHGTASMCRSQIHRCVTESAGPAFIGILSHKYGYRPIPAIINKEEFESVLHFLGVKLVDCQILRDTFRLDTNHVPEAYVLIARNKFEGDWWAATEKMKDLFNQALQALPEEDRNKYVLSITEDEMSNGIILNDSRDEQALLLVRHLEHIQEERHRHRHVIDVDGAGGVDQEAVELCRELKETKLPEKLRQENITVSYYMDGTQQKAQDEVMKNCDTLCLKLVNMVLSRYEEDLHIETDPLFDEVSTHWQAVRSKCKLFIGRSDLIQSVLAYNESAGEKQLFVLHGESGCGKTALMSRAAERCRANHPEAVLVVRLLGTTAQSGSARTALTSVAQQICRAYGKDTSQVPTSYKDLIAFFKECMKFASKEKPLNIFLDSLDQLNNEDFGRNLKWLSVRDKLPDHVHLVVSTLPGECLELLEEFIPVENILQVTRLKESDGPEILEKMLLEKGRCLTLHQTDVILKKFEKCPLPLYLRLAADIGARWHSYDEVGAEDLADDMKGLIATIFKQLQSRYGTKLIHHALGYITAAKNGLSEAELEDILSSDDEVLDELFEYFCPPIRRIPPLMWLRVREELGTYLVERGADGISCYSWYHRQFWETAEEMFLETSVQHPSKPFRPCALGAIADYFQGKYVDGKLFKPKAPSKRATNAPPPSLEPQLADRQLPKQPIVFSGTREKGLQLNQRKLSELPYCYLKLQDWERFRSDVCTLEFIEAKFRAGQGYSCMAEFIQATSGTTGEVGGDPTIEAMSKLIGFGISHLIRHPHAIYQLASQQVRSNPAFQQFSRLNQNELPMIILEDTEPPQCEDPCEMTLLGHTDMLHYAEWSPDGRLIASAGRDASVRVWDVYNGAEMLTLTDLPAANYPSDTWATWRERVCCFSPDSHRVFTGAEDGTMQYWNLKGSLIKEDKDVHSEAITALAISPDGTQLATASKDCTVGFWSAAEDWTHLDSSEALSGWAFGVSYSPDGKRLATGVYSPTTKSGAMAIITAEDYTIVSEKQGRCGMNLCCAWSPLGSPIVTGGSDSSVTIWDPDTNLETGMLRGHQGWIWCVKFTPDGSKLLTGSSDRTLGIWDMKSESLLCKLGGHTHRVAWAALSPNGQRLLTASLDASIKVWNFEAVASGRIPPVQGLHYNVLSVSPDQQCIASLTGWSTCASFTGNVSGTSATHDGAVQDVTFSPCSKYFISFDMGHTGSYPPGAEKHAATHVTEVSTREYHRLQVTSPAAVTASYKYAIVGTYSSTVHLFPLERDGGEQEVMSWPGGKDTELILALAWVPGLDHVAVAVGTTVIVWNISDAPSRASEVSVLPAHAGDVCICRSSPDGAILAAGCTNGTLYIYNPQIQYSSLRVLDQHTGRFKDLQFSKDGAHMGSVTVESCLRVWDVATMRCKAEYFGPVNKFGFVDGSDIVTGEATGNRKRLRLSSDVDDMKQ